MAAAASSGGGVRADGRNPVMWLGDLQEWAWGIPRWSLQSRKLICTLVSQQTAPSAEGGRVPAVEANHGIVRLSWKASLSRAQSRTVVVLDQVSCGFVQMSGENLPAALLLL